MEKVTMDKIVNLCKGRGFIFQGSEIYGGMGNTWDYGPIGVELKNNIKRAWWKRFVQCSPNTYGVDAAILMNPRVWDASGHTQNFSDPKMDCKSCKQRFRADNIIEEHSKGAVSAEAMTNEEMESYIAEHKIKCPHCNYIFSKVICPFCLKVNPYIKNNFQYGELECRHSLCSKKSSLVNCCHCQRINYFLNEKRPLIPGIKIKCGYCSQFFCEVVCPGCNEINYFPKGNFAFGRVYKCEYTHICSKSFMILICPECNNYSRLNEDSEGKKYTCNICNTLLANFQ